VTQLLDIFGFLLVVLRGLTLSTQSLIGGGIIFALIAPSELSRTAAGQACRRLTVWAALALFLTQLGNVAADSAILIGTTDLSLRDVAGANFFLAGTATVLLALGTIGLQLRPSRGRQWSSLILSGGIIAASVATSHSVARVDNRLPLALLTGLHYAATAAWVGGLPYLVLSLPRCGEGDTPRILAARFSRLAQLSVGVLFFAGLGLSWAYIDTPEAILGTAYGAMVGTKVALFLLLLALGAINFYIVRQVKAGDPSLLGWLRRFAEVEIGIAFTVVLAAGSLTSQPPAVDVAAMRVPLADIAERFTPRAPRLTPPTLSEVYRPAIPTETSPGRFDSYVPGQLAAPRTPAEIALSEFNHHWAGIFVLVMGLLAIAARAGVDWARHWPLTFLGLGVFLFFLADVDYWPLGPLSFWKGFAVSEVFQHRLILPLIVAFAWYEWRVRTGRKVSPRASLVFPLVCALGGAVLITHTHSLTNYREQLLAELSHIPIALLGILAGWSRWLELRGPVRSRSWLSWIWPFCFVLVGLWLLNYRES
jgi:putative copper resistance protein D